MKMVRVYQQADGRFTVEVFTQLPAPREGVVNLTDNVELFKDQTIEQVGFRIRDAFPPIVVL